MIANIQRQEPAFRKNSTPKKRPIGISDSKSPVFSALNKTVPPLHTGEVQGSIPCAPTTTSGYRAVIPPISPLRIGPNGSHFSPLNLLNCTCLIGAKSVGLVLMVIFLK